MSTGTVVTLEQFALGLLLVGCLVGTVRCNVARFVANVACARFDRRRRTWLVLGCLRVTRLLGWRLSQVGMACATLTLKVR